MSDEDSDDTYGVKFYMSQLKRKSSKVLVVSKLDNSNTVFDIINSISHGRQEKIRPLVFNFSEDVDKYNSIFPSCTMHNQFGDKEKQILGSVCRKQKKIVRKSIKKYNTPRNTKEIPIIIFDNIDDCRETWNTEYIRSIMMNGGSFNVNIIFIYSYPPIMTPPIRTCLDYVFVDPGFASRDDMKLLHNGYFGCIDTLKNFKKIYHSFTKTISSNETQESIKRRKTSYKLLYPIIGKDIAKLITKKYIEKHFNPTSLVMDNLEHLLLWHESNTNINLKPIGLPKLWDMSTSSCNKN